MGAPKDKLRKIVIQLNYLHSIFTQKQGLGELRLLIKSWTTGSGETLNTGSTYAKVKLFDQKGAPVDPGKTAGEKTEDELLLGDQRTIKTKELMQQVELTIF